RPLCPSSFLGNGGQRGTASLRNVRCRYPLGLRRGAQNTVERPPIPRQMRKERQTIMLDAEQRSRLIDVAKGGIPADLVLLNARIINVFTCEILTSDIVLKDGYVAAIAPHGA